MKQLLGVLSIIIGTLGALFLGVIMLAYGTYDLIQNYATLSFVQFLWDIILIGCREIAACIVFLIGFVLGVTSLQD
jgi:hypothetical protein